MRFPRSLAVVGAVALALAGAPGVSHAAASSLVGAFSPVKPSRILDTRAGNGAPTHTVGPNQTLTLQVAGRGGVPATSVAAVVLNVTVTNTSSPSFMTVYPTGIARPTASNLNITKGWTGANSVTVKLGADGAVNIYNQAGTLDVIADVTGYYGGPGSTSSSSGAGEYFPFAPFREIDTREGGPAAKLHNGQWINLMFHVNGWPTPATENSNQPSHIKAVAANITAVDADAPGFLTAWDGQSAVPDTSVLNFTKGRIVSNFAIIPTGYGTCATCLVNSAIMIRYTGGGTVHLVVDFLGFFDDNQAGGGLHFTPADPTRIVDTRSGLGIPYALGGAQKREMVPPVAADVWAISANVTGVSPTAPTFVQLWPSDETQPEAGSTLNLAPGDILPNAAIVSLGSDGGFYVYNLRGTTNLVMDLNGTYALLPGAAAAVRSRPSVLEGKPQRVGP